MGCSRSDSAPALAVLALFCGLQSPSQAMAHAKGLYNTQAEAQKRANELGCQGTHLNHGLWMPCGDEAMYHRELRQE